MKYPSSKNRDVDFFRRDADILTKSRLDDAGMFSLDIPAGLKASCEVSGKITVAKNPHNIGEELISSCCKDIMSNVLGAEFFFPVKYAVLTWIEMARSYPDVEKMTTKALIPFPTTYECKTAFSTFLAIKTKSRNRVGVTPEMRVAFSKTEPNTEELVTVLQIK
ncbi:Hypothetical predicted protein [Octopus vulgaris]|uniref:Uncharacterized protein n=1 Tax=Octopus vulgaris TaxID=6645 RepID=A0AA36BDG8_OCTVU|nr:Hypothetical predicted protein [Octopus vulgaris]